MRSDQKGTSTRNTCVVCRVPRCLIFSGFTFIRAIITLESHTRSKVAAAAIIESWIKLKWRSLVYGPPLSAC